MLKSFVKALGFMAALVLSSAACAVSMGNISVTTALGEPLKAEIALSDLGKGGKNKISVRLASPDAYKEAGLDYPSGLPKLKLQVETRADDEAYLSVTSSQPINDPFVNLMVELSWPSGKLLRSYTFLLDPPGFKPEQPKAEQVQPLAPSVPSAPAAQAEPAPAPQEAMQAAAPAEEKAPPAPAPAAAPAAKPAAKPAATSNVASGPIEVKRGDTLNKIARDAKPADVSLERMLVAMYRANEDQFDGHNMNRIRTGKILRLPEEGEFNKVEQAEAVKEIRAQVADWHAYRQKLAAASVSVEEQKPRQETSGKIATTVADKTPPVKESAREVVRLSKGEAPGDKAAVGSKSVQDKLHALQEEAIARDKMLKESYERIAILEKNIKEMQHLLELKGQPVSPKPEEAKPAETKPVEVAAPPAVSVSAIAPAAPAAKPARRKAVPPPPPPPSVLDEILGEPLYLAGGGAVLLVLLGGGFMILKRRGKGGRRAAVKESDAADTGSYIAAPVAPSPDTGDFTLSGGAAQAAPEEASDVDPIKEADLFLSFGRDAQAEDILKDALADNPGNQEIRLKLLSIYSARKDAKTFSTIARQVQDSGDQAAWAQVAEMGRKLDPGNPMYGAADEQAATGEMAEDESTITQSSANLDFDLGVEAPADAASSAALDVPVDKSEETSSGLDFDLGTGAQEEAAPDAGGAEVAAVADEPAADMASTMDFDLGLDMPGGAAAQTEAAFEAPAAGEVGKAADAGGLDFDITMETPSLAEQDSGEAAKQPEAAFGMDGLDFDVTGAHPEAVEEMPAEPAASAAEEQAGDSGAITLDFPAPETPAEDSIAPAAAVELADISLDLEPPAPAAAPAAAPKEDAKDARWHDVATKLDLARAYQEMGDAAGAREILDEVLKEGDAQQRAMAQAMIQQLS